MTKKFGHLVANQKLVIIFLGITRKSPSIDQNLLGATKNDFSHWINRSNDSTFVSSSQIVLGKL
jgi:hypothetical protein